MNVDDVVLTGHAFTKALKVIDVGQNYEANMLLKGVPNPQFPVDVVHIAAMN